MQLCYTNKEQVVSLALSGVKGSVLTQYIKQNYWNEDGEILTHQRKFILRSVMMKPRGLVKQYGDMFENRQSFDEMGKICGRSSRINR